MWSGRAAGHWRGTRSCEDGSEPTSPARTGPLETLGSGKIRSQRISQGLNVPTVLPTVGIARSGDQLSLPLYLLVRLFKLTTGSPWWMCSPIPLVDLGGRGCRHGPGSRRPAGREAALRRHTHVRRSRSTCGRAEEGRVAKSSAGPRLDVDLRAVCLPAGREGAGVGGH